jgi:predicted nucleic acid-binding protein
MALPSVLVTDTNIWIDLENGNILAEVFHLPYQFITTDFAIPEFVKPRWQILQTLGLETRELNSEHIQQLFELRKIFKNLSIVDLAAFLLAKSIETTLLTGDSRLNELAKANNLPVHGVLWLLDEMVQCHSIIALGQAANALRRMLDQGARLPAEECRKRLISWS